MNSVHAFEEAEASKNTWGWLTIIRDTQTPYNSDTRTQHPFPSLIWRDESAHQANFQIYLSKNSRSYEPLPRNWISTNLKGKWLSRPANPKSRPSRSLLFSQLAGTPEIRRRQACSAPPRTDLKQDASTNSRAPSMSPENTEPPRWQKEDKDRGKRDLRRRERSSAVGGEAPPHEWRVWARESWEDIRVFPLAVWIFLAYLYLSFYHVQRHDLN